LGGTIWGVYTCALAYAVGTALADFPLASVVISGAITTLLIGILLWTVRRNRKQRRGEAPDRTQAIV
jgi:membrane-associated protein